MPHESRAEGAAACASQGRHSRHRPIGRAISAGYWERVPFKRFLIQKTVAVMTFEEAPTCLLPHDDVLIDSQTVVVGAVPGPRSRSTKRAVALSPSSPCRNIPFLRPRRRNSRLLRT